MELAEDITEETSRVHINDASNPKAYEESNVADFTIAPGEFSENDRKIRLKSGIDIR